MYSSLTYNNGSFYNQGWAKESWVLLTSEMPERHTAQHIADRLKTATMEWGIPLEKISSIVHDNSSNMNLAADLIGCLQPNSNPLQMVEKQCTQIS